MRKVILLLAVLFCSYAASAQKATIEESTDIICDSPEHAIQHFKGVTTIHNEHGASMATFVWSCSKRDKLTSFKGQVTDASGRIIQKFKESELKKTEYSTYLAVDDYKVYLDYTPPSYPVTVTYEWTIESRDNLIEFPNFCPISDYDVSVKKAAYSLKVPKSMKIRYAQQNINNKVNVSDGDKDTQVFTLQVENLPALKQEPYSRPLREKQPLARFAPTNFVYYGTKGSLNSWVDYGKWEYSLIQDRDQLTEAERQELHQLTDGLKTDREKVEAIYKRLEKSTRYVAILLGIGGQQPAPAASVSKSGFGDCKGLSNYMRAMLKEIGIPSNYTTISSVNRRLQKDYASVGQLNHVILQVPLKNDTLWLECTNPQLPMGYVHDGIAGHDAIEVSQAGGRLVRLPVYADSTNLMHSTININLSEQGAASIKISQSVLNHQYESYIPLLKADEKDRQKYLQKIVHAPQAEIGKIDINESGAKITLDAEIKSQKYANQTGQRLFVPICPVHRGYTVPKNSSERVEDIWRDMGYLDTDDITISIPEGYAIESYPKDVNIEQPFASFSFSIQADGQEIHIKNRLLMKSGIFPKSQYPQLVDFIRSINSIYNQKVVLKST